MNNNQRFDDNIKEQFNDYNPIVQPHIWDNIVAERKKRKPVGFWFTFFNGRTIVGLSLLLLAIGGGAFIFFNKEKTTKAQPVAVTATQNIATPVTNAAASNTTQKIEANNEIAITSNNINKPTTISPNKIATDKDNIFNANNKTTGYNTFNKAGHLKIKTHSPAAQSDDENAAITKSKKNTTGEEYTTYDNGFLNITLNTENNYLKRRLFAGLPLITADTKTATLKTRTIPNVNLPGCPTIEKNAAGNKTYIEVYGGPDIAFRNLTDTGSNSAYLQSRKSSAKFSSAFSAGIRYTKVFNNGMSIRSGLNYSQINEKFTVVQGNVVQVTYIINANGDTTGSYVTNGTRYKTTYNKYKTVDVPLLVGYEMGNGKFHANINAGVIVNIYSWQKGDVLDMNGNPVNITTGKGATAYGFKTNIGLGFMAGASFYYKLNERLHVLAEPYYRYSLAPMTNETLTLKQKYNTAGLRVGLRLDLQ